MKLAIDVMGGDYSPQVPVESALALAGARQDVDWILFGNEAQIREYTANRPLSNVEIVHSSEEIEAGEEPVRAVRKKRLSSLVLAATAVRDGRADAMVSAGNTGALVAAGLLVLGRLTGIERPALAPVLPTFAGTGVLLLDAGATMDASVKNLIQYAHMGTTYSRYVLGVKEPRVGLLNVGTEPGKGNQLTKETFSLLQAETSNFVGNIEARDLLNGECDVVVCDGFVGNVVLKLVEGVGLGMFSTLKESLSEASFVSKIGGALLKPELRRFRDRFDYAEYGGAPFLGVGGGCIKAHGSSNHRAWQTALKQAIQFCEQDLLAKMKQEISVSAPSQSNNNEG
ncbi:phosphate acyltransferase PlsX [Alicyclobacillus sp. SO9]|uniref:phosphate acyltransferase PlsX n=1 Tax=Alicyclobacillus sp. SO9 TaxID=2665646 RepID=UPI0018E80077|nr:phosphate acyltransferase PlsX [Alicyclobacillus sp. SO9]QQE80759.1 phosphate acyltransferase PlsX [Alicyclobacillus sp. SO9]